MGLFNKTTAGEKLPWIQLTSVEQFQNLIEENYPALIFKHSTRCAISSMALSSFEKEWNNEENTLKIFFLDLLKFRNVSNEIATVLNVVHQSPQVIIFKGEEVFYHASHSEISARKISSILKNRK